MTILLCAALPLVGILLTFGKGSARRSLQALLGVSILCFAGSATILIRESNSAGVQFLDALFVSDPSSRLFLALISAVFTGVALYLYSRAQTNSFDLQKIQSFVQSAFLFFSFSVLATLSNHRVLMWIFIEASTLSIVPLIYHQKGMASIRAAWKYLLFSCVGLGLVSLGFLGLDQEWGLVLIILGFGTKLGLAPMYAWLPDTYDLSPSSVTVLLSGIQFNVVILAIFRVFQSLDPLQSTLVRYELIGLGLLSIIVSTLHIIVEKNYKRLIAYASINHAGVIAVGLGLGKSAAFGVLLYVISNALVKAILFLTCGNIKARYNTKSIEDLQGLIKIMPFSGAFFMIGTFALLGFAPFGSFLGELLLLKSMIDTGHFVVFGLFCLLMTIVFMALGRSIFPMIWGEPKHADSLQRESISMVLPLLFFVILLLSLGIYLPAEANTLLQGIL